jgi:2',3'-cyclic-nucleotide 2'-phosphodiesterase
MRLLFIGDVVGTPGRRILRPGLKRLRAEHAPDLVVVNGENAAGGVGITPSTADEIFHAGADVITSGNHVWDRKEILPYLDQHQRLLRPANYPDPSPGRGVCVIEGRNGVPVAVVNLMGRVFMGDLEDPFRTADAILRELDGLVRVVVVDFHAEATSEKMAMGWHLDGRVAAVIGSHTHVPTADERVLPGGTAFITDMGMTGPWDSVIGVEKELVLERFMTQRPVRFTPASGDVRLCGVLVDVSDESGRALAIRRLEIREAVDAS